MNEIVIHSIEEAVEWEYKMNGLDYETCPFKVMCAELRRNGVPYTIYFDVTDEEYHAENRREIIEQWIMNEWNFKEAKQLPFPNPQPWL